MSETTHEDKELVAYELGYHLVPSLGESDLALRVSELVGIVTVQGGTLLAEGYPQVHTLAYTVRRLRGGKWEKYATSYFGWMRFKASPEALAEVKEALDHHGSVVRYLLVTLSAHALAAEFTPRRLEGGEVAVEPKSLVQKREAEKGGAVVEEELDKEIEGLLH